MNFYMTWREAFRAIMVHKHFFITLDHVYINVKYKSKTTMDGLVLYCSQSKDTVVDKSAT